MGRRMRPPAGENSNTTLMPALRAADGAACRRETDSSLSPVYPPLT